MKIKNHHKNERNSINKLSATPSSIKESIIDLTKHQMKHIKVGFNVSALPAQNISVTKKTNKLKKTQSEQSDKKHKTIRHSVLMTSPRSKGLKFKIKPKKSSDFEKEKYNGHQNISDVAEDCEQYCLVEDSFIPIVSKTEHQKLEDIMRSTADTTKRVDEFNRSTLRKIFRLKKSENTAPKEDSQSEKSVAVRSKKVSKKQAQVEASPFYTEIGIQYSQRPNFLKPIIEAIKQKKSIEVDIQTEDIVIEPVPTEISPMKQLDQILISQQQKQQPSKISSVQSKSFIYSPASNKKQQTLSDLLLKLQFKHLPNDTSFITLSKTQKQHYTDLFSSLISKLNCSPRQKSPRQIKSKKQIQIEQVKLIPLQEIKVKHEKLQMEVFKRESMQMNWIQQQRVVERNLQKDNNDEAIDTSLMAVNNFLLNFFCYIELNYMQEFLKNIRKQYGPSYIAEFQRVTRTISNYNNNTAIVTSVQHNRVLQQHMFEQFTQQLPTTSPYQPIHLQSIFDYINCLLDTYRPYYQHHGQPFPWAVKIYNNICEYVIDETSLEIIFVQVKQNIQKSVSMLCGLLVQEKHYKDVGSERSPLNVVRGEKEKVMMEQWMRNKSDENHEIECEATMLLNAVSEDIYDRLLIECMQEMKLLF